MVPVELKTGYWRDAVEHGAQLTLYTLMLGDRYKQRVPFGVLHYTRHPGGGEKMKKDDETTAIKPQPADLAHLMHRRNAIAAALVHRDDAITNAADAADDASASIGIAFANGALPPIEQCRSECERCFVKENCMAVNAALEGGARAIRDDGVAALSREMTGHLTDTHARALAKWLRLIDMEAAEGATRRATPWMRVDDVTKRGGFALDGLTLVDARRHDAPIPEDGEAPGAEADLTPSMEKLAYRLALLGEKNGDGGGSGLANGGVDRLRDGDRLVLSRKSGEIVVCRVVLKAIHLPGGGEEGVAVDVAMERKLRFDGPGGASADELWRIDRDDSGGTMSGRARAAAIAAFSSADERSTALRRRLFDLETPVFDASRAERALSSVSPATHAALERLNDEQRHAVTHALSAKDYALVVGFPGSGKSATLAALVRALVDLGKSVLITSHTHNAVDNILERLPSVGVESFLRVGGEDGKASPAVAPYCPGGSKHRAETTKDLQRLANESLVVGATCYAVANNPLIARRECRRAGSSSVGRFDVVLVDEAGQMTLPSALPPLLRAETFVLVGDPKQLPPLVRSPRADEEGLGVSPLALLSAAHPSAVITLSKQYRMNDDLAKIPNVITYEGALRAANDDVARRVASLPLPPPPGMPGWLLRATDPECRVVMLDTTDLGADAHEREGGGKPTNAFERAVVLDVLRGLLRRGASPSEVYVLSPYNGQVDALAKDLSDATAAASAGGADDDDGVDAALSTIEALTIDRAQGRDVDVVVVSFARANERRDPGSLLADARRLNVALTRARGKLVLVGCGRTLVKSPVLDRVVGLVVREGWMQRLTREDALGVRGVGVGVGGDGDAAAAAAGES